MDNIKSKALLVFIVVVITVGSLSVTGLLQSTEKLISSGVIVRPPPPVIISGGGASNPPPPPPEPKVEIDVFKDSACTQKLTQFTWGEIEAGKSGSITIYVKNKGDKSVILSLAIENSQPSNLFDYMTLNWNYDSTAISSGNIKQITLRLNVENDCPEMSEFNFDVVIVAS